jgi:hypothetical protein
MVERHVKTQILGLERVFRQVGSLPLLVPSP